MDKRSVKSGFIITALSSGSGKTTITVGLLRALRERGLNVSPFKIGPDFIDTIFHKAASGKDSINLDIYMSDENHVKGLINKYSEGCDVCLVEGVMGMLDGYDGRKGSAVHLAELTGMPLVLVVNAASTGYSIFPLLWGVRNFDRNIKLAGIVFNNVASERHQMLLEMAVRDAGVNCLGYIGRDENLAVPSRHLGLSLANKNKIEKFVEKASKAVARIDIDRLLSLTTLLENRPLSNETSIDESGSKHNRLKRIALAKDDAFNFIYPENIESLKRSKLFAGEVIEFSPLKDKRMPDADFLYLPGGYPELYASHLESNESMRMSIREYIENGGYAFAECGGMLYLCERIDGCRMCGILPATATMEHSRLHLGYRSLIFDNLSIRGHEFHYSDIVADDGGRLNEYRMPVEQRDVRGEEVETSLYRYKNAIMGYTHLYWGNQDISRFWC